MDMRLYIWSFKHRAWWRPEGLGYTTNRAEAGRFTPAEIQRHVLTSGTSVACGRDFDPAEWFQAETVS